MLAGHSHGHRAGVTAVSCSGSPSASARCCCRRPGFFADKKSPNRGEAREGHGLGFGHHRAHRGTREHRHGVIPQTFRPFTALTDWINMGGLLIGPFLIVGSIVLVVLAVGLILRFRTAWALTLGVLVLVAGAEFLYSEHRAGCRGGSAAGDVAVLEARRVRPSYRSARRRAAPRARVPRERRAVPRLARQAGCGEGGGEQPLAGIGSVIASRREEGGARSPAKRKTGWEQRAKKARRSSARLDMRVYCPLAMMPSQRPRGGNGRRRRFCSNEGGVKP